MTVKLVLKRMYIIESILVAQLAWVGEHAKIYTVPK